MSQKQPAIDNQGRREFLKAGGAVTAALLAPSALAGRAENSPRACPRIP